MKTKACKSFFNLTIQVIKKENLKNNKIKIINNNNRIKYIKIQIIKICRQKIKIE